jgi:hypothetical protein
MDTKKWYTSKTLWFGVAYVVLAVAGAVLNFFGFADFAPSPDLVGAVAAVTGILIVILRLVTNKPVE